MRKLVRFGSVPQEPNAMRRWLQSALNAIQNASNVPTPANEIVGAFGAVAVGGAFSLSSSATPAQITGDANDFAPAGHATAGRLRLNSDTSRNITGLAGGADGRMVLIQNVGANDIVLKTADAGSEAANRFAFTGDITIPANGVQWLIYDGADSRWRAA